jgi:hypothetical protein
MTSPLQDMGVGHRRRRTRLPNPQVKIADPTVNVKEIDRNQATGRAEASRKALEPGCDTG